MIQPPPPPPPKKSVRNIVIALIAVAVILTASVGAFIVFNPSGNVFTPFDFGISASDSSGTAIQGNSVQTTIQINKISGNAQTVTLSADSGSSGIQCSFGPNSGSPDFSSTLTMTIPSSTSTNSYSVTITATSGGTSHSTSYAVSVLSAKVYVSGTVTTTGLGTNPSRIEFVDTQTGVTYTGSLSGNSYSISLDNQHTYAVTVTWNGLLWSTGTFSGGSLHVYAPVGYTSMSQDYSG